MTSACECFELGDVLIDPDDESCATDGSPEMCTGEEETLCEGIYTWCPTLIALLPTISDVDSDGDGEEDSISMGVTFGAIPARIIGYGVL